MLDPLKGFLNLFLCMFIVQTLPVPNGFLDAVVLALPAWRKMSASLPVVTWPSFIMYVRSKVNMLASEDHLKELMCQLQLCGEVSGFLLFSLKLNVRKELM